MGTRNCQNCKKNFVIEPDDLGFYHKIEVAPPTFCPDCRRQRRLAWRNYLNYYKTTCGLTGESVISLYRPDSGITVYKPKVWHSDKWSPFDYGRDYDFSRPFFAQYAELLKAVPKPAMDNDDGLLSVNCMYVNDFGLGKNCYLVVKAWKVEDIMYSFYAVSGKNLVDVYMSFGKDEGNYETVNTEHCYQCRYVYNSRSCSDCAFSYDCRNCDHVFMCTGLRGKSYCFKNQEVGKEKYEQIMKEYALNTHSGVMRAKAEFEPLMQSHPRRPVYMVNCNDCSGDLIFNSHNCKQCFVLLASENCKFCNFADGGRDSYDTDAGGGSELICESDLPPFSSRIVGSFSAWNCQNSSYLTHAYRTKDCFGCTGLKDAQYCILNKKYDKEEYFALVEKIKQQMKDMPYIDSRGSLYSYGDYPPPELSYFPYQDSAAQELYPLEKSQIEASGYSFLEPFQADEVAGGISANDLPDDIREVSDDILNAVIISKSSDKKYRITPDELSFYRKYSIPLPRESFFERNARRRAMSSSLFLYERTSDKSGVPIVTSYPPGSPEKVWSNEEYKKEFE